MQRFDLLRPQTHLLGRLHEEMGRLFSDVFDPRWRSYSDRTFPPLNLWEDDDNVYASCELPGVQLADIEVLVNGRELTIQGERKPLSNDQLTFHRCERRHGPFRRVVEPSKDVDADKVDASLRDGVLALTLPKVQAARARKVEVQHRAG